MTERQILQIELKSTPGASLEFEMLDRIGDKILLRGQLKRGGRVVSEAIARFPMDLLGDEGALLNAMLIELGVEGP